MVDLGVGAQYGHSPLMVSVGWVVFRTTSNETHS